MFQLKTEFNFLLMNITFCELIMSVFGVPVDFIASAQLGWKLGEEFCRVTGFLLTLLGMYSINIFTAIALYRYIFIKQNVRIIVTYQIILNLFNLHITLYKILRIELL